MQWNLRLTAAQKGVWTASEMKRLLAEGGMVISAGKMSGLWSGQPPSIKLADLDVLCAVLDVTPNDLLLPEPVEPSTLPHEAVAARVSVAGASPSVRPLRKGARSLPPEV